MSSCRAYGVRIFIAGDSTMIEHFCQHFCSQRGACVTVTPTTFVYTGGKEAGAIIGIIHYPRFPREDLKTIDHEAKELAKELMHALGQRSCTVSTPTESFYLKNVLVDTIAR